MQLKKRYKVGIVGATGMVGQRLLLLLENHPYFDPEIVAASSKSKGKTYHQVMASRWVMDSPIPDRYKDMEIYDCVEDCEHIASKVDFIFCAVHMPSEEIKLLEEKYAKLDCPVVSNTSANRKTADVPMVIPEINPSHLKLIPYQKKRLGTQKGFIVSKSNCSLQSYIPAIYPLLKYGIDKITVSTYQSVSGSGETLESWKEMQDNIIPYIPGEEEKSELEPRKILGNFIDQPKIYEGVNCPAISSQCIRVPVYEGHLATVFIKFDKLHKVPTVQEVIDTWNNFKPEISELNLPSSPNQFLKYMTEPDRPQPKLDKFEGNGMGITIGRLREDSVYDMKFVSLSHNTIRGAAGGAVLLAELLAVKGYFN